MAYQLYFNEVRRTVLSDFSGYDFVLNYIRNMGADKSSGVVLRLEEQDIFNLFNACNEVLENHELAPDLLPVDNDNYDEEYFDAVEEVRDSLDEDIISRFDNTFDVNGYIEVELYS